MIDDTQKKIMLNNCNDLPLKAIVEVTFKRDISLEEFIEYGLEPSTVEAVRKELKKKDEEEQTKSENEEINKQKENHINRIRNGRIMADDIRGLINKKAITFDDISDAGLPLKTVNALKHYCSTDKITKSYTIDQLPPMEEGRTDIYFIGLPGSGKSTMIAGLLNGAHKTGVLRPDPYHKAGTQFQTDLIQDLGRGVLPERTDVGSYNYIAATLQDLKGKNHPFNIVDVPGELYEKIQHNAEVEKFLKYINNKNKKILIFVIDSLEHDNNESMAKYDQSVVFPNILQIFNANGVLEQTDAIYLVVNKFDAIKETKYSLDDRRNGDIALDFLNEEFLNLKNNCISARSETKNSIRIKVMPFSIGSLSYGSIINSLNMDFAKTILNQITNDSFVVRGEVSKIFK